ncbi:hypothetical protein D9M72_631370 [compost metagenome]
MTDGHVEDRCHLPLVGAMAHQRAVATAAKGQRQAVEQDGLTGAGFTGQHREPGIESQIKPFNQDDIADRKLGEHPGSYLP